MAWQPILWHHPDSWAANQILTYGASYCLPLSKMTRHPIQRPEIKESWDFTCFFWDKRIPELEPAHVELQTDVTLLSNSDSQKLSLRFYLSHKTCQVFLQKISFRSWFLNHTFPTLPLKKNPLKHLSNNIFQTTSFKQYILNNIFQTIYFRHWLLNNTTCQKV